MKNFYFEAICIDGRGWDAIGDDGVWGPDHADPVDRIFRTAAEAQAIVDSVRRAGCWTMTDDDGATTEDIPVVAVEKCSVYELLWGDHDQDEIDRVVDIHGGPIRLADMPLHVAKFLERKFSGVRDGWAREQGRWSCGASTGSMVRAQFYGAVVSGRLDQVRDIIARREGRSTQETGESPLSLQ